MFQWAVMLMVLFSASLVYAQQHKQEGIIYENKTHVALAGINIENLTGKFKTQTDKLGRFLIPANINDLLVFAGFGYKADTIMLTNLNAHEFYVDPLQHMLNEVVIYGKNASPVNQSVFKQPVDPYFHNQTMTYQRNVDGPNADGSIKGGFSLRVWSNKKAEKNAKKEELLSANERISEQSQQLFSEENVGKYVPLKDKELHSFVLRYSPGKKTFDHEDFNLAIYISKCYKEFIKLSPEERLKVPIFAN